MPTSKTPAKKILSLTAAQLAEFPAYREKWLKVGLCTDPARRVDAEAGARAAYKEASLEPPRLFVWLGSPLAAAVAAVLIKNGLLKTLVNSSNSDQVRDQVRDQVIAQVRAQVSAQVRAQVIDQVSDQVSDQVREDFRSFYWWYYCWGSFDAGWLSYYDFFDNIVGLQCCKRLAGMKQVAESAGFWWPLDGICIMSERPVQIHRDERGRLHCADDYAVKYPDGWGVTAWHGLRIPSDIVLNPETITVERIDNERNAEVRRAMVEKIGYERYILESGAKLIHSDETGALYRKEFADDEALVVVHVINSTPEPDGSIKKYMLRVPPDIKRARQAVAWTFNMTEAEYRPLVET